MKDSENEYIPHVTITICTTDDAYKFADLIATEIRGAVGRIWRNHDLVVQCTYEVLHERELWKKEEDK